MSALSLLNGSYLDRDPAASGPEPVITTRVRAAKSGRSP